jgi:hypothetical protein
MALKVWRSAPKNSDGTTSNCGSGAVVVPTRYRYRTTSRLSFVWDFSAELCEVSFAGLGVRKYHEGKSSDVTWKLNVPGTVVEKSVVVIFQDAVEFIHYTSPFWALEGLVSSFQMENIRSFKALPAKSTSPKWAASPFMKSPVSWTSDRDEVSSQSYFCIVAPLNQANSDFVAYINRSQDTTIRQTSTRPKYWSTFMLWRQR